MPGRRRTSRPLSVTVALGGLLVVGTLGVPSALAAPAPVVAVGTVSATAGPPTAALAADASPEPGVSPTGPTTPSAEDDGSEGLPWTGIVVGGGLGLLAGIGLMVLSKRRENRG